MCGTAAPGPGSGGRGPERVAVPLVVPAEPARADAQDQPAAADVVDGPGDVRDQVRVAVGGAGDERAELDPARRLRPRGEQRPALEVRRRPVAVERAEVVPGVEDVVAEVLGPDRGERRTVRAVLGMELGGDADRSQVVGGPRGPSSTFPQGEGQAYLRGCSRSRLRAPRRASAKQLRAWDAAGLFRPVWVDPSTGYRCYSPAQLPELRRILALRDLGVPLAEIGGSSPAATCAGSTVAARAGARARRRGPAGGARHHRYRQWRGAPILWSARSRSSRPVGVKDGVEERSTRSRSMSATSAGGPAARRAPSQRDFRTHRGSLPEPDPIGYRRLPAVRVASIIHRGPYAGVAGARAALRRWVGPPASPPPGPMRTLYLAFGAEPELRVPPGWVVQRDADFVTELQLPVA